MQIFCAIYMKKYHKYYVTKTMMNQRAMDLSLLCILRLLIVLYCFISFRRIYSLIVHNAQAPTHTVTHTYIRYEFFVQLYVTTITEKKILLHSSWAMARHFFYFCSSTNYWN